MFNTLSIEHKMNLIKHYEKYSHIYKYFRSDVNLDTLPLDEIEQRYEHHITQLNLDRTTHKLTINQENVWDVFVKLCIYKFYQMFIDSLASEKTYSPL